MNIDEIDVASLLPHSGEMVLLERLLHVDDTSVSTSVVVENKALFSGASEMSATVPMWMGIEYMAQTIAAWAGYRALLLGVEPKIGFLLGTRKYTCNVPNFKCGDKLVIEAQELFQDSSMASFACKITSKDLQASANLNVFQPNDQQLKTIMESV